MAKVPDRGNSSSFEAQLRTRLADLDVDLPEDLWALVSWLEEHGQHFSYTRTHEPFLSTSMVKTHDALWSSIGFEMPQDFIRHWIGKPGFEREIIPLVRCGGDGSYFALWMQGNDSVRYIFLGSEGEAFVVAEDTRNFIALLAMGYCSVEGRFSLELQPHVEWDAMFDTDWPKPDQLSQWVEDRFDLTLPAKGSDLLPTYAKGDPFEAFLEKACDF